MCLPTLKKKSLPLHLSDFIAMRITDVMQGPLLQKKVTLHQLMFWGEHAVSVATLTEVHTLSWLPEWNRWTHNHPFLDWFRPDQHSDFSPEAAFPSLDIAKAVSGQRFSSTSDSSLLDITGTSPRKLGLQCSVGGLSEAQLTWPTSPSSDFKGTKFLQQILLYFTGHNVLQAHLLFQVTEFRFFFF